MKKLLFLLVFLLIPLTSSWAVAVASLYVADVPIASQTDDLKEQAVKDGFLQVLVKLSGDPDINSNPLIKDAIQKADYYVQEYSYSPTTTASSEYLLRIRYDGDDVTRLLKRAGVAYWGETRPLILVWLVNIGQNHQVDIVTNDASSDIFYSMKQQGKKYGLPLIFPMMDVDEMAEISPTNIQTPSWSLLNEASKRYAPDAILVGTVQPAATGITSKWTLSLNGTQWQWTLLGDSTNQIIITLMKQLNQTLAKHYVVKASEAPQLRIKLQVSRVMTRTDLSELTTFLKQLTQVQQIQLSQVSGDVVQLYVLVQGSLEAFKQNATVGQHLILKSQDAADGMLVYEWVH